METKNQRNCKTICLFFPDKQVYQECMTHQDRFRGYVDKAYQENPELFPTAMEAECVKGFETPKLIN